MLALVGDTSDNVSGVPGIGKKGAIDLIGAHGSLDALLEKAKVQAPSRALVDIDDVGMACAFLAHDAARLMTGQVLYIDGGYNIID